MDTKYRNNDNEEILASNIIKKTEEPSLKIPSKEGAISIILTAFFLIAACLSYFEPKMENSDNHPYFYHYEIQDEVIRYAKNLNRFYIYFKNFEPDTAYKTLDIINNEIAKYKQQNYNNNEVVDSYAYEYDYNDIDYLYEGEDTLAMDETAEKEIEYDSQLYEYYESIPPETLYSLPIENLPIEKLQQRYKQLSDAIANYEDVSEYLKNADYFSYCLLNKTTNKIYTNTEAVSMNDFENQTYYDKISLNDSIFKDISFNGEELAMSFQRNRIAGTILIPYTLNSGFIYETIIRTNQSLSINKLIKYSTPFFAVMFILCLLYTIIKHKKTFLYYNDKAFNIYKRLPFIIKICIGLSLLIMFENVGSTYITDYVREQYFFSIIMSILLYIYFLFFAVCSLNYIYKFIRCPKIITNEFEIKSLKKCSSSMKYLVQTESIFLFFMFILIIILCIGASLFGIYLFFEYESVPAMILFLAAIIGLTFIYIIISFSKLSSYIKTMADGKIEIIEKEKGILQKPIENLNNINYGIKNTVNEMIKTERLKTELITNVSHDLKTPLTSIISYIDLLKGLSLNDKEAVEYINVIEEKSEKLKFLINDLFEASKLSTGQTKLDYMNVDIIELIKQTMGELSFKISASEIDFKITAPNTPLLLKIDGKKMWRVFENLLNNIIKYSPKGSRAYIDISETEKSVIITMKNISSYEMDFEPSELFERFKRGDSARSTEGSGLGLSIAKSIVELHSGKMDINIDGDLFKITIILYK